MRLTKGVNVGPYEVVSVLGTGGMSEVYRARDTRLSRDVALKVVHEAVAANPEFLHRFEHEARLAGSLNHPNVLAVFDVGLHEGTPYLVTELLQGETLAQRLAKGPLPLTSALDWAAQVATGLAAAHAQGIVHRDVKPANIFITREGQVKLLDFGIAKLAETASSPASSHRLLESTLTPSGGVTSTGQVIGTPRYMAPEQVRGEPVDARTDLFGLGAVLHEMLSGTPPFPGETAADVQHAILHADPAPLPPTVPPSVALLVAHALEKDPERRVQSAKDFAFDLEVARSATGSLPVSVQRRGARWWWIVLPVGAAAILALGVQIGGGRAPEPPPSVTQLTFRDGYMDRARFGPDGRAVFFSASWHGEPESLYAIAVNAPDYNQLGIHDAMLGAVASTGELAVILHPVGGVLKTGTLARVPGVGGGLREVVGDVSDVDWAPDGSTMAVIRKTGDEYRVEFPVGSLVYQSKNPLSELKVARSGRQLAFLEYPKRDVSQFDLRASLLVVEPGKSKRVLVANWDGLTGVAWSDRDDEVWFSGSPGGSTTSLWAVSMKGRVRPLHSASSMLVLEDVSSDGRALAYEYVDVGDIGVLRLATGENDPYFSWYGFDRVAGLSTDGDRLLLQSGYTRPYWALLQRTDGSPPVRLGPGHPAALSGDGKWALVLDDAKVNRVWLLPTGAGTSRSVDFPELEFVAGFGAFLPDGKRAVVAIRDSSGLRGCVLDLDSGAARVFTPPLRYLTARLSPDGRFLAAQSADGPLMAYPIEGGAPKGLAGVGPNEALHGWTTLGLLTAARGGGLPKTFFRVNPETGTRQAVASIGPGQAPGARGVGCVQVTPDEQVLAYCYSHTSVKLFLFDFHGRGSASTH